MKSKVVFISSALLFFIYSPMALWLNRSYVPIPRPPEVAGKAVLIYPPLQQWPGVTNAATVRDRQGLFDDDVPSNQLEIWENNKKLGPAQSNLNEIVNVGFGRYLIEPGRGFGRWITFATSDNTNPTTNNRIYWLVEPPQTKLTIKIPPSKGIGF
jgi:hypothetical protein